MLSHPAVAAVNVGSTAWDPSFVSYFESASLGVGGYAVPVGSAAQLQTLPWTNIDQIRITFSEDVIIQAGDLSISGVNKTAYVFSNFSYDPNTFTAVWTLDVPIGKDKLLLDLDADGIDPVRSVSTEEVLDGAWTDCQSTFNSGDLQGGTDFEFRFNVLPTDVDASGIVTLTDALYVVLQYDKTPNDPGFDPRRDLDGDGTITTADYYAVRYKIGGALPSGDPVGMNNDAPTTSNIPDLGIAAGTVDHVLELTDFFADAETAPENLAYSIVNNSNPTLFSTLDIIEASTLLMEFASGVKGNAVLSVRATDGAGLIVETTFTLYVSDAPAINNFYCINELGDYWTLTGTVTDNDDDVEGYVVTFGGVLAPYGLTAVVAMDGVFSILADLSGVQMGTGTAQTKDPHGVLSNLAQYWVIA